MRARCGLWSLLCLALCCGGCTTYQRVDIDPARLQAELRAGNAARPGDRVKVTLQDGSEQRLRVVEVRDDMLIGEDAEVPIGDVVALESRDYSPGRTAALAGGLSVGFVVLVTLALSSLTFMM